MLAKKHQISIGLFILTQCLFVFNAKAQKSFIYYDYFNHSYGIKQVINPINSIDTIGITPPIYPTIENFNQFGLAVITRVAPFFSSWSYFESTKQIFSFNFDSVYYWNSLYPDSILNNYRIVGCGLNKEAEFNFLICDKTTKPITSTLIFPTMEDLLTGNYNNYIDQWGNFYPNVFNVLTEKVLNGRELIFFHEQHGIINEKGKVVLPLIYDYVGLKYNETLLSCQNPIYPIVYRNKLGFIDSLGKVIIEPKFENNIHSEGVKDMTEGERFEINRFFDGICKIEENDRFGIIDTTGKVIIPLIYEHIYFEFTNKHDIPYEHIHYITAQDNFGNSFKFDLKGNLIDNK